MARTDDWNVQKPVHTERESFVKVGHVARRTCDQFRILSRFDGRGLIDDRCTACRCVEGETESTADDEQEEDCDGTDGRKRGDT